MLESEKASLAAAAPLAAGKRALIAVAFADRARDFDGDMP
jgi:hypothetical protein